MWFVDLNFRVAYRPLCADYKLLHHLPDAVEQQVHSWGYDSSRVLGLTDEHPAQGLLLMSVVSTASRQLMKLESWKRAEKRQIRAELRQLAKEERQRQQKAVQVRACNKGLLVRLLVQAMPFGSFH
jgi:hypothetical protein